jgi:sodium-dependent dicarboxylate transporter 2/3/5
MKEGSTGNSQSAGDEYRFNLTQGHIAALVAAPLLALLVYWLSLPQGAPIAGALAVAVFAAVLWITEALPLPVTALLIPVGLATVGVFEARDAYTSFGNPVLFLVLGGYALAVEVNGVDRWLARRTLGFAGSRTIGLLIAFMVTSAVLSMLISNTATTALLLPVALGILSRHPADINLSPLLLLGVAYGASIGGVATLTGSQPNAMVHASGQVAQRDMMRAGLRLNLAAIVVITLLFHFGVAG